jgi:hypothetical protein
MCCALLQKRLLNSLLGDQGGGFEAHLQEDERGAEATITKCLYHTIMKQEGKPHLLRVCCCSQDAPWCGHTCSLLLLVGHTGGRRMPPGSYASDACHQVLMRAS